ncbi:protein vestigial [Drosophila guanche]|uniref:Blast:Protein vestigial n=1 Tax=Drosophila guanche TaxID=7266 RepID=A0A3B0J2X4_DROGU|nr:protein vestigial [Drosophila guanche]SPP75595.1 blast:Protein vestigial [Drosophila guanche]
MAVSCPEVMYGAYYPYLYGRAGPSRSFYQYERFNQDLYSSSGVNLAASSSASGSSHSPCSPILPPSVSANAAAAAVAAAAHNSAAAAVAVAANQAGTSGLQLGVGVGGSGGGLLGSNVPGSSSVGSVGLGMSPGLSGAAGHSLHSRTHTHTHSHPHSHPQTQTHTHSHPHSHPHPHTHTHQTKEEDLNVPRSEAEARLVGSQQHQHHNESSCSSGPDSPRHVHAHSLALHGGGGGAPVGASSAGGTATGAIPKELPTLDAPQPVGGNSQGQAQYLSATCVVFTNYSGDTASVVDEHFSRALNYNNKDTKESQSPMSTRNFPPSFWNSNYVHPIPAPTHPQVDLYGTATDTGYATDPWVPHAAAAHYGSYAHAAHAHAAHAHAYHHNMAQYGSLLRLPQQYASHGSRLHHDQPTAHALEYSSYPTMAGLEAQVQETSKDLYWF